MKPVLPAQLKMLEKVAEALSEEFLREMVFIGGCTTSLLVDQENYALASRYTYDVDLLRRKMEKFGLSIDVEMHWNKIFSTTCERVLDVLKI